MNVVRPCLSCGFESPAEASACTRCGERLRVHAATVTVSAARAPVVPRRGVLLAGAGALAAVVAAGWWWMSRPPQDVVQPQLRWAEPAGVAAWATRFLTDKEGLAPATLTAEVVPSEPEPRRVLLTAHPPDQSLARVVRAVARLMVEARREGAAQAAHLAVVKQGDAAWMVPVGEAADLASSPAALARWLGMTEDEMGLDVAPEAVAEAGPAVALAGPVPPPPSDVPPPGPEPGTNSTEPAPAVEAPADGAAPAAAATSPTAAPSAPTAPAPADAGPAAASAPAVASAPAAATAAAPAIAVRVARGNGPVPPKAAGGQLATPIFRLQVAAGARRALKLRSLTLKAKGTLPEIDDIAWVDLRRETDPSGRGASKPVTVGQRASFTDDDGTITFSGLDVAFGEDSRPLSLLVTADLEADVVGGTIELSLPDAASIVVENAAGEPVAVSGPPVRGVRVTVTGNVAADPEQARLDALAEAGPDAIDPNLERLRLEAAAQREAAAKADAERAAAGGSAPAAPGGVQPPKP